MKFWYLRFNRWVAVNAQGRSSDAVQGAEDTLVAVLPLSIGSVVAIFLCFPLSTSSDCHHNVLLLSNQAHPVFISSSPCISSAPLSSSVVPVGSFVCARLLKDVKSYSDGV